MEKEKVLLEDLEIQSFSLPEEQNVRGGHGLTNLGGFTCHNTELCSDTYTEWENGGNGCAV